MNRLCFVAILALFVPTASVLAQEGAMPDPRIQQVLGELEYQYEIDKDGDYRAVFKVEGVAEGESRTQEVIINSKTEIYDSLELREVWSFAYRSKGPLSAKIANQLLKASFASKIGAWEMVEGKDGTHLAIFAVKLPADADTRTINRAITAVLETADAMERELTNKDEF